MSAGPLRDPHPELAAIEQLRRLQRVTDATLGTLSPDELLDELLERVREALSVDTAAVLLLDPSKKVLVARAAKGLEEEVEQHFRIPVGPGFAGRIAADRAPVIIDEVDHHNVLNPILRDKGVRSLLGVPLIVQGDLLGVLHVGTLTPRLFGDEDVELLQLVGDRLALALKMRLHDRERLVADTLQRSLLPEALPDVPGLSLASRYVPAASGIEVGGDWYDAFLLPDGRLAVAIGDVAGRGLPAASVMGRTRNALRGYAFEGHPPGEVARRLDDLVSYFDTGNLVTLLYGEVDPELRALRFILAGHVPPVLITAEGAEFVEAAERSDPPLGAVATSSFRERVVPLDPGASIFLYTDGLVERRDESLSVGLERVRLAASRQGGGSAAEILSGILDEVLAGGLPGDDVAALVLHRAPLSNTSLRFVMPARPRELARMRQVVRRWLAEVDAPAAVRDDVVAAVSEACANSIKHAYGLNGGTVVLEGTRRGTGVRFTVRDSGRWRAPRQGDHGRGIALAKAMMDGLEVEVRPEGTSVTMWKDGEGKQ